MKRDSRHLAVCCRGWAIPPAPTSPFACSSASLSLSPLCIRPFQSTPPYQLPCASPAQGLLHIYYHHLHHPPHLHLLVYLLHLHANLRFFLHRLHLHSKRHLRPRLHLHPHLIWAGHLIHPLALICIRIPIVRVSFSIGSIFIPNAICVPTSGYYPSPPHLHFEDIADESSGYLEGGCQSGLLHHHHHRYQFIKKLHTCI